MPEQEDFGHEMRRLRNLNDSLRGELGDLERLHFDLHRQHAELRKKHTSYGNVISDLRKQYAELEELYYASLERRQDMVEERELLLDKLEKAQGDLRYIIEGVR